MIMEATATRQETKTLNPKKRKKALTQASTPLASVSSRVVGVLWIVAVSLALCGVIYKYVSHSNNANNVPMHVTEDNI